MSTLIGWVGGDSFKYGHRLVYAHFTNSNLFCRTVYFFAQGSPLQFKICAIFQLSIDIGERAGRDVDWIGH
jgi:hypothetical protein